MAVYKVLVVDDQLDIRRLLRSGLESLEHSFAIVDVPSGEEALLVTAKESVDLLVSDIRLAGMSGLELLQKLRHRLPKIKAILISGQTDASLRQRLDEASADFLLFEPLEMHEFLEAVNKCLGLVSRGGSQQPIKAGDKAPPPSGIALNPVEYLSEVLRESGALGVALFDYQLGLEYLAGQRLPQENVDDFLQALRQTAKAGEGLAQQLGASETGALLCVAGQEDAIYLLPLGAQRAILLFGKRIEGAALDPKICRVLLAAEPVFRSMVSDRPAPVSSPDTGKLVDPDAEMDGETDAKWEDLFHQAPKIELDTHDLNEYWDTLAQDYQAKPGTDELSFDQAQEMGISPDEDDE